MSEIPEDILKAAEETLGDMLCNCKESCGGYEGARTASIRDIARAILAERDRCVMDGWQDISTAPKDGTAILVHTNLASSFNVQQASYVGGYDSGDVWLTAVGCVYNVKHWMPLTTPPNTDARDSLPPA